MRDGTSQRLDPVRLRPPRPRSLLRYAVIAALLVAAAGVLLLEPAGQTDCAAKTRRVGADTGTGTASPSRGEPLAVPSGHVGVPVQLAEPATAAVLRPGVRVDVFARTGRGPATSKERPTNSNQDPSDGDAPHSDAPGGGSPAGENTATVVLARDVLVLAVNTDASGSPDEGVVYLAVAADEAERVASVSPDVAVGVTVRPG